jgi:hypothetical protein
MEKGAHHACWLLLQALFMIAKALPVPSNTTTAATANNKGLFICDLATAAPNAYPGTDSRKA